jgi:cyclic GMP-AMP synthase DncV-like protein
MHNKSNVALQEILQDIELPEGAYEKATERYKSIGKWFDRPGSKFSGNSPHIYPQGSFRLGTAIKPLGSDHYDLDMSSTFRSGISKYSTTQEVLKNMVGEELNNYRATNGIKKELDEKRRCWRLEYADDMSFHIDVVPSIPEESTTRLSEMRTLMMEVSAMDETIANEVSALTVSITDNEHDGYEHVNSDWNVSNPEGFAKWFEHRMRTAVEFLNERSIQLSAKVDDIPTYRWKTPLQQAIQLLKRHRDVMFGDDDSKPISIIITTLATRSYNGERTVHEAVLNIVNSMENYINPSKPLVPNPVNPKEDFADKWYDPNYQTDNLEKNFRLWLTQAKIHFAMLINGKDNRSIVEAAKHGFSINIDESILPITVAAVHTPPKTIDSSSARPWLEE